MKNFLSGIIKKLYWKYCDPDIVAMTRIQLHGIGSAIDLTAMSDSKRKNYIQHCYELSRDVILNDIINRICREQTNEAINRANDWMQTCFARFTINGAALVQERITAFASEYVDKSQQNKPINKHSVI